MPHTNQSPAPEHPAVRVAREFWREWSAAEKGVPQVEICAGNSLMRFAADFAARAYAERDARVLKALEAAERAIASKEYVIYNGTQTRNQVRAAIAEMKGEGQ